MIQKKLLIALFACFLILPLVSADIGIFPTAKLKIYFEKNGQPYNGDVNFTVIGYGYRLSSPEAENLQPGTYTPEKIYIFSVQNRNYGDEIDIVEPRSTEHIDYFELEGRTADGQTFKITNIAEILTNCSGNSYPDRKCELRVNLENTQEGITAKKGFWQSIGCFFKRLFGGSC